MTLRNPSARLVLGLTGVMFADLATKLAAAAIAAGHTTGPLVPIRNHEFSLGVAGAPLATTVLLAGLGIALAAAFTLGPARRGELPTWIPACLLGGSLANLVDRIAFGSVHDFLATPWIVFNLADLAVLAGLAGLAGLALTRNHHPRRSTLASSNTTYNGRLGGTCAPTESDVDSRKKPSPKSQMFTAHSSAASNEANEI